MTSNPQGTSHGQDEEDIKESGPTEKEQSAGQDKKDIAESGPGKQG